jgi:hypothetical protein
MHTGYSVWLSNELADFEYDNNSNNDKLTQYNVEVRRVAPRWANLPQQEKDRYDMEADQLNRMFIADTTKRNEKINQITSDLHAKMRELSRLTGKSSFLVTEDKTGRTIPCKIIN